MQITLDVGANTKPEEIEGLLALFATVCPEALEYALEQAQRGATTITGTVTTVEDLSKLAQEDPMAVYSALGGASPQPVPTAPPPSPTAVSATPAPPVSPVQMASSPASSGPALDQRGLPWDARIHSTPATMTVKNEWRAKRKVDPTLVISVEAELRGAMNAAPAPQPAAPASPAPPVEPPPSAEPAPAPVAAPIPAAPPASPAPPPPPPVAAEADAFAAIMGRLGVLTAPGGKLTVANVNELCEAIGLKTPRDLLTNRDKIATFEVTLDSWMGQGWPAATA